MSIVNSIVFDEICQRGCLRCRDVQRLKNLFYASEFIDIKEAESLFEINDACRVQDIQWAEFFIDAICNFTIDHLEPEGCVTLSNAEWLMSVIAKDCAIQTQTEFELLLTLLDRARWSSENLIMFALHQIRIAIISGSGPLRAHCAPQPGVVMKQDVAALRRVFYSTAGDRHIAVTQSEAGVLFEINDATADAENCAEWSEFFAKAITNSMMAASGYRVPLRQHVLGCEPLLQEQSALPDDCRAISSGIVLDDNKLQHMLRIYQDQTAEEQALTRLEQQYFEMIIDHEVTSGASVWLAERIGCRGFLTPNEILLLRSIKKSRCKLSPTLEPLLDRLEIAV